MLGAWTLWRLKMFCSCRCFPTVSATGRTDPITETSPSLSISNVSAQKLTKYS